MPVTIPGTIITPPGQDAVVHSLTVKSSGPYSAVLPGNSAVATPAGVDTGKLWDWGGGVYNVMAAGCAGDGVTLDTANIALAYAARTPLSVPGEVVFPAGYAFSTDTLTIPVGSITRAYGATIKLKAATAHDLLTFANATHTDTAILGGIWDGNGANQTGPSSNAVINGGVGNAINHNRTRIQDVVVLNAAQHGVFLATIDHTTNPRFISRSVVTDHGLKAVGFGFYVDYAPATIIDSCWANGSGASDNFELGHLGQITLANSVSIGGQINYPFSDDSRIIGCLQINNTIQNDNNTAVGVLIEACTVLNATPAAGYAGISGTGSKIIVRGCRIQVVSGDGLFGNTHALSDSIGENNIVETLAGSIAGSALCTGGTVGSTGNQLRGNVAFGKWAFGVDIIPPNALVDGNVLDLTAATATAGIRVVAFGITGILASNGTASNNQILGSPTTPISFTQGNILNFLFRDNFGGNPIGTVTSPAISASLVTNHTGVDCMVFISTGGTNNVPVVSVNGVTTGQVVPISSTGILVGTIVARGTIQLTGATTTGTTWKWVGAA